MSKTEDQMRYEFFELGRMPCCNGDLGHYKGPQGGACTNIMCAHCGATFNIGPTQFIQQIGEPDAEALAKVQAHIAEDLAKRVGA